MSKGSASSDRAARLAAQDHEITEPRLKEMRMHLEQSLAEWERGGRVVSRAAWIAIAVMLLDYLAAIPLTWAGPFRGQAAAMIVWGVIGLASLAMAFYFTILHRVKYARHISQGRFDLQMSMLRELQAQVDELRSQAARRTE
ncbi:MAG: hypothetical protein ABUL64_03140 [Singulisphaera sp.]